MKATITVSILPFIVPNYVTTNMTPEGKDEELSIRLSDLDPETLDKLCRMFRDAVFSKAGKRPPPEVING